MLQAVGHKHEGEWSCHAAFAQGHCLPAEQVQPFERRCKAEGLRAVLGPAREVDGVARAAVGVVAGR
eukprot:13643192-Alexandrium_andersonii.AAC.1